jgi:hypothetical protein
MGIELNNEQILTVYKCENWFHHSSQQVFEIAGAAGTGKAQPIDTLIPTPNGKCKLGDLKVGDYVFNRLGKPVKILEVFDKGELDTYRVNLSDGRSTCCNNEHLWTVMCDNQTFTCTLQEIIDKMDNENKIFYVPKNGAVEYSEKKYDLNPHDAASKAIHDTKLIEKYMDGSIEQRLMYLRSAFESFGCIMNIKTENPYVVSLNKSALKLIKEMLISVGYNAKIIETTPIYSAVDIYKLEVFANKQMMQKLFTKKYENYYKNLINIDDDIINNYIQIESIENLNYKTEMRCIFVDDEEHLYLTNDYIVTHNTTIVLYLIEKLGLKLDQVLFLAYQGKAACRLAMTGLPAQTIHSAIYRYEKELMKDSDGRYLRNEQGKIRTKGVFVKREYIGKNANEIKLIVIDEAGMVNETIAEDLKSFGIPIIVLGDLNQLPPVFGNPYFLNNPDVVLTKIMRQNEGNPIVYLSQQILAGNKLNVGLYGKSEIINKTDLNESHFSKADIVLTETNKLRWNVNNFFREQIRQYKQLDYPHNGEKVICRKNNWKKSVDGGIYLTNGMSGYVDCIHKWTYDRNRKTMAMDFRPDFTPSIFKDITFNYEFMFTAPHQSLIETDNSTDAINDHFSDRFEFGYAITVYLSQGNQYGKVLFLNENIMRTKEDQKKLTYTAITRAIDSVTVVV